MSLINDAIKKANQANKETKAQASEAQPAPTQGMHTAPRPSPGPGESMTGMFIIAGVVVFVLLGGFLLILGMKNRTTDGSDDLAENVQPVVVPDKPASPEPSTPDANSPSTPVFTAEPVVVHASIDDAISEANPHLSEPPTSSTIGTSTNAVPVEEESPAPPIETKKPDPTPSFPKLKLQGIFYRLNDPSVMINGETLWIDDDIEGATVKKIERDTVTLEFNGRTQALRLR